MRFGMFLALQGAARAHKQLAWNLNLDEFSLPLSLQGAAKIQQQITRNVY